MVGGKMTVYIIMHHFKYDYRDTTDIVMICLNQETANKKLKWLKTDNTIDAYWIEDHEVDLDKD